MPPKAKKGKKKAPEIVEPEHDPTWDRVSANTAYKSSHAVLPSSWLSSFLCQWQKPGCRAGARLHIGVFYLLM
jgi:hypothetical protein